MLSVSTSKAAIFPPAAGEQDIAAFLEQESAAGRPLPTLRALHARFRGGSYTRLNRIRREFLAKKNPGAAAAPPAAAPPPVDLAPLLREVEKVQTALSELRRELLPRLTGSADQMARIEAKVSAPAARPSPAPPVALDVIEARLFDQDQAIRDLATAIRTVPQDLAKNLEEQLAALLPRVATMLRRRARRSRRKPVRAPRRRRRGRKRRVARLARARRLKSVKPKARYRKRQKPRPINKRRGRPRAQPQSRAHKRKGRPKARRRNR